MAVMQAVQIWARESMQNFTSIKKIEIRTLYINYINALFT